MHGAVLGGLAAEPLLSRQRIQDAIARREELQGADPGTPVGSVSLTPSVLSLEAWSHLWSMMQAPHTLSIACLATVVMD